MSDPVEVLRTLVYRLTTRYPERWDWAEIASDVCETDEEWAAFWEAVGLAPTFDRTSQVGQPLYSKTVREFREAVGE